MRSFRVGAFLAWLFAGGIPVAAGAGFELDEQDVELMAAAFAGRAAASANASVLYWNPAGMAGLQQGWNYNAGMHAIMISGKFQDTGSTSAAGTPMIGRGDIDGGEDGIIPNAYVTRSIGERWVVGIGFNVPFGLSTSWPTDSTVRYHATKSEITVVNIEPAVSFRLNKQWSFGFGLNVEHIDASLQNQIDFGSIGASQSVPGLLPQQNDGSFKVSGQNWAIGWTVGTMFELNENHRFGLSYRSRVYHGIDGQARYDVPTEAQPLVIATGAFVDTSAHVGITLPDKFILSGFHQVHPDWAVVWDVAFTNWSTVETLRVEYGNPNQPTTVQDFSWNSTMRYSIGAIWTPHERWTVRFGTAWDESPVPDRTRGPRLADNDRLWLAVGFSYRFNEHAIVHVSYFHLFMNDTSINQSDPAAGILVGDVDPSVDAVSIGITGTF